MKTMNPKLGRSALYVAATNQAVDLEEIGQALAWLVCGPPQTSTPARICTEELKELCADGKRNSTGRILCEKVGLRALHVLAWAHDDVVKFQFDTANPPSCGYRALCAGEALARYSSLPIHNADAALATLNSFTGMSSPHAGLDMQITELLTGLLHVAAERMAKSGPGVHLTDVECLSANLQRLAEREHLNWNAIEDRALECQAADVEQERVRGKDSIPATVVLKLEDSDLKGYVYGGDNALFVYGDESEVDATEARACLTRLASHGPATIAQLAQRCRDELDGSELIADRQLCATVGMSVLRDLALAHDQLVAQRREFPSPCEQATGARNALARYTGSSVHDLAAASDALHLFPAASCSNACLCARLVDAFTGMLHLVNGRLPESAPRADEEEWVGFATSLGALAIENGLHWDDIQDMAIARYASDGEYAQMAGARDH